MRLEEVLTGLLLRGLPPYHPLVTSQGFDPAVVYAGLRADAAQIVASGYNLRGEILWMIVLEASQKLTRSSMRSGSYGA